MSEVHRGQVPTNLQQLKDYMRSSIGRAEASKRGKLLGGWNRGQKFPQFSAENHYAWKGDDVSYRSLHKWVERQLGKPKECKSCRNQDLKHRQYHWANKSRNYLRLTSDWIRLCVKCHKAYDKTENRLALRLQ